MGRIIKIEFQQFFKLISFTQSHPSDLWYIFTRQSRREREIKWIEHFSVCQKVKYLWSVWPILFICFKCNIRIQMLQYLSRHVLKQCLSNTTQHIVYWLTLYSGYLLKLTWFRHSQQILQKLQIMIFSFAHIKSCEYINKFGMSIVVVFAMRRCSPRQKSVSHAFVRPSTVFEDIHIMCA